MTFTDQAYLFAKKAHGNQKRKYTFEPYITHPKNVFRMVREATDDITVQAAALLHDVLEDTDISESQIQNLFGPVTLNFVLEVTDISKPEDGNRAIRKAIDREHLSKTTWGGATIKLADIIDNSISIIWHDPKFAKIYMKEKALLLKVLKHGDAVLFKKAQIIIDEYGVT